VSRVEKEIEFLTEVMKLIVIALIADTGGVAGLFFKINNPVALPLIAIGIWFGITLLISLLLIVSRIQELIRRLE